MASSATDTRFTTLPGTLKEATAWGVIIQLDKCVVALTRRQFLEGLKAGKRWRRHQQFQARVAKAQDKPRRNYLSSCGE